MNSCVKNPTGSALITVLILCSLLLFVGLGVFNTMRDSRTQTAISLQGLQARSLGEAALERCLLLLRNRAGQPLAGTTKDPLDQLRFLLLKPAQIDAGRAAGTSALTSEDKPLKTTAAAECVLTLEHLRLAAKGDDYLDKLVQFMTAGKAKDWSVRLTVKPETFYRNGPPAADKDFLVPGVEMAWNIRPDVCGFLEGDGFVSFTLQFPPSLRLFNFAIPVGVGILGFKINLFTIDVLSVIDKMLKVGAGAEMLAQLKSYIPGGDTKGYASTLMTLDTLCHIFFNKLCYPEHKPPVYPYAFTLDHIKFPDQSTLWPAAAGVSVPEADKAGDVHIEKYGALRFHCEAAITDHTGHKTTRRIEATREVRISDLEPPAPMYSFFVENRANAALGFNHLGGEFYVNSRDLARDLKGIIGAADSTAQEPPEIPGLIRINYQNGEEDPPLIVSTTLFGNPFLTGFGKDDSRIYQMLRGFEGMLTLDLNVNMTFVTGKRTVQYKVNLPRSVSKFAGALRSKYIATEQRILSKAATKMGIDWPDAYGKVDTKTQEKFREQKMNEETRAGPSGGPGLEEIGKLRTEAREANSKAAKAYGDWEKSWKNAMGMISRLNCFPDVLKMSCSPIEFAVYLATRPMNEIIDADKIIGMIGMGDVFQGWETPYFGTSNWIAPVPLPIWANGSTHLFGMLAAHPPLTREIEGKVVKLFRQWRMCLVGLDPGDRLPTINPPFFMPPFPVPVWYAGEILNKYGYNFPTFKSFDPATKKPSDDTTAYDPAKNENLAPNLYTTQQYAKKAAHYYPSYEAFLKDLPQRLVKLADGRQAFALDGVNFIAGSLGTAKAPFTGPVAPAGAAASPGTAAAKPTGAEEFLVTGRGMIVCSGNIFLGVDIRRVDGKDSQGNILPCVFSLISREGGLMVDPRREHYRLDASLYTDLGLLVPADCSLWISGNWVTNQFAKGNLGGAVRVDYLSSRTRSSLASLHPIRGKFDPARYHISLSPVWASWKVD
jgi:hypothetical protein